MDQSRKAQFIAALAPLDPAGRATLLYQGDNRALLSGHGANVMFFRGTSMDDAEVIVLRRRNRHNGLADGIGMLGGAVDRLDMDAAAFAALSPAERVALAEKNDDVVPDGHGDAWLTGDLDIIARRTLARESGEELADLGLDAAAYDFDFRLAEHVPMPGARDDNYLLNIWTGKSGYVIAGNPINHIMRLDDDVFDRLVADAAGKNAAGEALGLEARPLRDVLPCWGQMGGAAPAPEDGRDLERDYRYPHEWFNGWVVAATLLNHDPDALIDLAAEIQGNATHRIDFNDLARRAQVPMETLDLALGTPPGTVKTMHAAMDDVRRWRAAPSPLIPT